MIESTLNICNKKAVWFFSVLLVCLSLTTAWGIDTDKYITVDEIEPTMDAYCLTVMEGTKIEKFDLKIVSIMRNSPIGRDSILVVGTEERFRFPGPIKGCSGSPVYIDGRLAGALAASWAFSKDALYMVTPIEEMLRVGKTPATPANASTAHGTGYDGGGVVFDLAKPIDFAEIQRQLKEAAAVMKKTQMPLVTSLPDNVCKELEPLFGPMGLVPIAASAAGNRLDAEDIKLESGSCLTIPLVTGDISMAVAGTVTETAGDKVYGLGHGFLGYGPVDLPMATGNVHTVVSNIISSFKLATPVKIVGAIRADESTGIYGLIGAQPKMIPIRITVERYNDTQKERVYNCHIAVNRIYTPLLLQVALLGTSQMHGQLPLEHLIKYKANIQMEGFEPITFENVSSKQKLAELITEAVSPVAMLMNNPYRQVEITGLDFHVQIVPGNLLARIHSAKLSDSRVKPGQTVDVDVVLESHMSAGQSHRFRLRIPGDLAAGEYDIVIAGAYDYEEFLRERAPYKFTVNDLPTMLEAINDILAIRRDKLYLAMTVPPGGVTIQRAQLPYLPSTKALLMRDAKRTLTPQPYQHWIESEIDTKKITIGSETLKITVENEKM